MLSTAVGGAIAAGTSFIGQRMMYDHADRLERTKIRLQDSHRLHMQKQETALALQTLGTEAEMMPMVNLEHMQQLSLSPTTATCGLLLSKQSEAFQRFLETVSRLRTVLTDPAQMATVESVSEPTVNDCVKVIDLLYRMYGQIALVEQANNDYVRHSTRQKEIMDLNPATEEQLERLNALFEKVDSLMENDVQREEEARDRYDDLYDSLVESVQQVAQVWPDRWRKFSDQIAPLLRAEFDPTHTGQQ